MQRFFGKLIGIKKVCKDIKIFRFSIHNNVSYKSGQFFNIFFNPETVKTFIENKYHFNFEKEERLKKMWREYSVCNPENKKYLEFLIKKRDNGTFTVWLFENAHIGNIFQISGPFGSFVLNKSKYICFLTAGVGIAPIICMIRDIYRKRENKKIFLFFSNKYANCIPFKNELKRYGNVDKNFKCIFTLTREKKNGYEYGRINMDMIFKYIKRPKNYTYYICGPRDFVISMVHILKENDIKKIKFEGF